MGSLPSTFLPALMGSNNVSEGFVIQCFHVKSVMSSVLPPLLHDTDLGFP
jgi:hypothetical protein